MGSKHKDWCSKKGCASRKKGMYEKEKRWKKACIGVLFGCSFLLFLIFGAVFAERSVNAAAIEADLNVDELVKNPEAGKKLAENSPATCAAAKIAAGASTIDFTKQRYVDATTNYLAAAAGGGAVGVAFAATPGAPKFGEDFRMTNMYDACRLPMYDIVGFNYECPSYNDMVEFGKKLESEGPQMLADGLDIAEAVKDWVDACGTDQACYEAGTGWSFIWAWNAAWCIIMAVNFLVLTFGACFFWPRYIGTVCNWCLCICHLVGFIIMLAGAAAPMGRICSYNKGTSTYEGDYKFAWDGMTYQGDHAVLVGVGIVMAILWCCQVFVCCAPCLLTPAKD